MAKKSTENNFYDDLELVEDLGEIAKAVNPEVQFKNGFAVPSNDDYTDMNFTSSFGKIHIEDNATQVISNWDPDDDYDEGDDYDEDEDDMYQEPVCTVNNKKLKLVTSEDEAFIFQNKEYTIAYETASEGRAVVLVTICRTVDLALHIALH